MTEHRILLPLETTLRLKIATLELELAQAHARCLQYESQWLVAEAQRKHAETTQGVLATVHDALPGVPCTFDADAGALVYQVAEPVEPCEDAPSGAS